MVKKLSLFVLALVLALGFAPQVTSATPIKADAQVNLQGELNVLNIVKVGGKCDKIYVEVRLGKLNKLLKNLKLKIKYDVYFSLNGDPLKGKIVGSGELDASGTDEYYRITFDPSANPEGPAGNYALKIYLLAGKQKSTGLIAKVKINKPCKDKGDDKGDNGNDGNNGDNGNNGNDGNNGDNGNNDNNGNNGDKGQQGNDKQTDTVKNPKGGKLPKTANDFANYMIIGVALILAGAFALIFRRKFA